MFECKCGCLCVVCWASLQSSICDRISAIFIAQMSLPIVSIIIFFVPLLFNVILYICFGSFEHSKRIKLLAQLGDGPFVRLFTLCSGGGLHHWTLTNGIYITLLLKNSKRAKIKMNFHSYWAFGTPNHSETIAWFRNCFCHNNSSPKRRIDEMRWIESERGTGRWWWWKWKWARQSFLYGAHVNAQNRKQFDLSDSPS